MAICQIRNGKRRYFSIESHAKGRKITQQQRICVCRRKKRGSGQRGRIIIWESRRSQRRETRFEMPIRGKKKPSRHRVARGKEQLAPQQLRRGARVLRVCHIIAGKNKAQGDKIPSGGGKISVAKLDLGASKRGKKIIPRLMLMYQRRG